MNRKIHFSLLRTVSRKLYVKRSFVKVLILTGGVFEFEDLASTELFEYPSGKKKFIQNFVNNLPLIKVAM